LITWGPTSIREFELKQEDRQLRETFTWSVRELRSYRELGHCVYSYAKSCRSGSTSIWSLGLENEKGQRQRILTIAVEPRARAVTQVRGRFNALPGGKTNKKNLARAYQRLLAKSQNVLGQWMSNEFLSKTY